VLNENSEIAGVDLICAKIISAMTQSMGDQFLRMLSLRVTMFMYARIKVTDIRDIRTKIQLLIQYKLSMRGMNNK
jgi:hypothetical protein